MLLKCRTQFLVESEFLVNVPGINEAMALIVMLKVMMMVVFTTTLLIILMMLMMVTAMLVTMVMVMLMVVIMITTIVMMMDDNVDSIHTASALHQNHFLLGSLCLNKHG